jgi:transposase
VGGHPARYGPHTTCSNRFNRWRRAGIWDRLLQGVSAAYDGDVQMIDSSPIRVHQHAANGQKNIRSRCMGRSRGGLTTKIHALVDAEGRPIALKLTEGQAHDGRAAADIFDTVQAGHVLLADSAYDSDALRTMLTERGAWANIRPMTGRKRTLPFSGWVYDSAMPSSAYLTNLNTSVPWRRDMTCAMIISSPASNSPGCVFGCAVMSL